MPAQQPTSGLLRITRHRSRLAAVAILPVLALAAACGGGDDDSASVNTSGGASASSGAPAALASYLPGTKATGSPVKVGIYVPEGGAAVNQPEVRVAAQAAAKYVNAQLGGLSGHVIDPVICKGLETAASAADCAQQFVTAGVVAVASATTGFGEALVGPLATAGIPYINSSGASNTELTGSTSFMLTGGFPGILVAMAKYSAEQKFTKVSAVIVDVPGVVAGVQAIGNPAFKAAGIDFKLIQVPAGTADMTPQLTAGLNNKPDAMVVVGDSTFCASALKASKTISSTAKSLLIQPCLDPAVEQAVGGASGLDGSVVFASTAYTGDDPESQLYRYVMATYAGKSAKIDGYTATGYQPMLALARAVNAASPSGDVTAASVLAAMKAAKNIPIPVGDGGTFTCDGKQFPNLSGVCSDVALFGTAKDGVVADPTLVHDFQ